LLPPEVQAVIGRVHANTEPALALDPGDTVTISPLR
jgi:arginine/ornithine N-succinyltransferase beta subunit